MEKAQPGENSDYVSAAEQSNNNEDKTENISEILIEVGSQPVIDLFTGIEITSNIKNVEISNPPNPFSEGTLTFVGNPSDGLAMFTPVPRFTTTSAFGVTITDVYDNVFTNFIRVVIDKSYDVTPSIYYIPSYSRLQRSVRRRDPTDPVGSNFSTAFGIPGSTELGVSLDDALLYYAASFRRSIGVKDVVTRRDFILIDSIDSYVEENQRIHSMGVDQDNHIMYLGFYDKNSDPRVNFFLKIYLAPYDRYGSGTQDVFVTKLFVPQFSGGVTRDLDVERGTGYIFSSTVDDILGARIYKIHPVTGDIVASSEIVKPGTHISFANDDVLYAFNTGKPGGVQIVDPITLNFTPTYGETFIGVSDLSRPLYNH